MATLPLTLSIDAPRIENIGKRVRELLDRFELSKKVKKGERIGLTAGSRGIKDNPKVLEAIVSHLKDLGAAPFLVPCMGSHGGATAEGQLEMLESLGITEKSIGAPILSSTEVQEIGQTKFGTPVLVDKNLYGADKIIVVNRIKPHTDFEGEIESGLVKMMVIGMAKPKGALMVHRMTIRHGFPAILAEVAPIILKRLPIFFGMGIIENPYDETAFIELARPEELIEREKSLLKKAKERMVNAVIGFILLLSVYVILYTINPREIKSTNPGCCFKKAGWQRAGVTSKNKLLILEKVL